MQELLKEIMDARRAVRDLMSPNEAARPIVGRRGGSEEFSWSLEDPARDIIAHAENPKREEMMAALAAYQERINRALDIVRANQVPRRFAVQWLRSSAGRAERDSLREVEAEVLWIARGILTCNDLDTIQDFERYAFMIAMRWLQKWSNRRRAPIEVPRAVARDSKMCGSIVNSSPRITRRIIGGR